MLRTPQFYVLYAMFVMMATGGLLVTANAGPIAEAWGIPAAALTLATSLNAVANGGSRVFWGWVSDKTGRELTMGDRVRAAGGLPACSCSRSAVCRARSFAVTLVATFFTWGEVFSLFPSLVADYFGTQMLDRELRRAVLGQGRRLDHRRRRRRDAVREVRQLDGVLLRQRRAGAGRVGDRVQPARVASPSAVAVGIPATAK